MGSQLWGQVVCRYFAQVGRGFSLVALALFLGSGALPAKAQSYLQNIGVPPFTTELPVEDGFINAANGNLHLEIPLASYPERAGRQFKISLIYDSAIWQQVGSFPSLSWQPTNVPTASGAGTSLGGWRLVTSADKGTVSYGERDSGYCAAADDYRTATYNPFIWTAPDGTQHSFNITTIAPLYPGLCNFSGTPTGNALASDGSGFAMVVWNYTQAKVYAPDGTIVYNDGSSWLSYDTNGNYYTFQAPATWMGSYLIAVGNPSDTLGKTPVTTSVSGSQIYFDVWTPNGTLSRYTATTAAISVNTAFGSGNYHGTITVISEIDLPDGTKYMFGYDTPNSGVLTSMTLPTGGQVFYSHLVSSDANGNQYISINNRTTPDGTWNYAPGVLSSCPLGYVDCQQQLTVTKPSGDQTAYTFTLNGGAWPNAVQYYTGTVSTGTRLATTTQCFSFVTVTNGSCSYNVTAGAAASYIHLLSRTTTVPIPSGNLSTTTQYTWDSGNVGYYGQLVQMSEWNFGTPLTNAADRTTSISYLGGTSYGNANIINRPTSVTVTNSGGAMVAQTNYYWDYESSNMTSVTGTYNHDDSGYGITNTVRGNLEAVQRLDTPSTYVDIWMAHDTTGQLTTSWDSNGNKTTYAYATNYSNSLVTTITNPLSQPTNLWYDWGSGLLASLTDPNNRATYFNYDSTGRPTTTTYPDGGWTLLQYPSASENQIDTYTGLTTTTPTASCPSSNSNAACRHEQTLLDGLGRVSSQFVASDPDGQTTVATQYDSNGRVLKTSNPYRSTSDPTYGWETPSYDGLDRVAQITNPDNSVTHTYYGAAVATGGGQTAQWCNPPSTYGSGYPVLYVDEAGKKRQNWIDGFGRVMEADEFNSSGVVSSFNCYTYDLNNNLTGLVTMGGYQTRSYSYDMISRLKSKTEPETEPGGGATMFDYGTFGSSTNPLCSGNNAAPCTRTDARGIKTTYGYDALNRLTSKTYSDGTPKAIYTYDQSSVWGHSLSNPVGRLISADTYSIAQGWTAHVFSYDPMGRVTRDDFCWPIICTWDPLGNIVYNTLWFTYDRLGDMLTTTNGAGVTLSYSYDSAGRPSAATSNLVDSQHPATLATVAASVGYSPSGSVQALTLGNGLMRTAAYNSRLQPCRINLNTSGTYLARCTDSVPNGNLQDFNYGFGTSNNGNLLSWSGTGTQAFNRTYSYDSLNRLSGVSSPSDPSGCTGYSWSYDIFGNRTAQTPTSGTNCRLSNLTYNLKNQITSPGFQYDAAGNLTNDSVYGYTYDAENRITQVGSNIASYVYDAFGRRVRKTVGSTTTSYFYDLGLNPVTEMVASTWNRSYAYFGSQVLAQYSSVTTNFIHQDHLGSARLVTNYNGSVCDSLDYLPFGEQIAGGTCIIHKFTGYERDAETDPGNGTGNDFAFARFNSSRNGRFLSPDPVPGDITDPQTLNRYAYVRNNPVNATDPSGLFCFSSDGGGCGGFTFGFGFGFGWGWGGGGWDSGRIGPQRPVYYPPSVGTSPNPATGDPTAGETNGIPNGLRIPTLGLPGLLLPGNPGCEFGACGGVGPQSFGAAEAAEWTGCALAPEYCALIKVIAWGVAIYEIVRLVPSLGHISLSRTHSKPGADPYDSPEAAEQYERDLETCRSLASPAARARCYGSAEQRRFAINNHRPVPPLITW